MNNEGASELKKIFGIILTFVLVLSVFSTALAAYTLPEKMERQLQVGSGLRGTLTVRANADAEQYPLIHSIQNAEFEIRGIQYEGNQHYYIYQPGEGESLNALTEICMMDGKYYLRSDLLDEGWLSASSDRRSSDQCGAQGRGGKCIHLSGPSSRRTRD